MGESLKIKAWEILWDETDQFHPLGACQHRNSNFLLIQTIYQLLFLPTELKEVYDINKDVF